MSNGFQFDLDVALDNMAHVTEANDTLHRLTVYAVVCAEHGGIIVKNSAEALEGAAQANEGAPEGHTCQYVPLALALDPRHLPDFPEYGDPSIELEDPE